jgi:hypothetical protein
VRRHVGHAAGVPDVLAQLTGHDYAFGTVGGRHWTRRFLCDGAVSRLVMTAAGDVVDSGRATPTFTAAQVRDRRARPALRLAGLRLAARVVTRITSITGRTEA